MNAREIQFGAFYWVRDKEGEWNIALADKAGDVPVFFPFQTPDEADELEDLAEIGPCLGTAPDTGAHRLFGSGGRVPRDELVSAWRRLILGDNGRPHIGGTLILADLEAYCCGSRSPMEASLGSGNPVDPYKLACLEGRRQVLFHIRALLEPPQPPGKPEPEGIPYDKLR